MNGHATAGEGTRSPRPEVAAAPRAGSADCAGDSGGVQAVTGTEGPGGPYRPAPVPAAPGGLAGGLVTLGSEDAPACSDGGCPI